jgi:hypothetical protein
MQIYSPFVDQRISETARTAIWISLVTASSVVFSLGLACAAPFAALAAVAATKMTRKNAAMLIAAAWFANQLVGYLILDYPRTPSSFGWGAAIGATALLGTLAAYEVRRIPISGLLQVLAAFVVAFIVYQAALVSATTVLPSGGGFALGVILYVAKFNALGLVAMLLLYQLAVAVGLMARPAAQPAHA